MAETTPTWISCQDPTCYTPQEMRLHDARLVCGEGVSMNTGGALAVTQNVGDPLCVDIASGGAWVDADLGGDCQGVYGVHNCGITTLCADDGDPTDPRIDRVVFQVNDASLGGTQCDSELMIIAGQPSPAPVAPPEPDNAITLALITVTSAGITEISDQRQQFTSCGGSRIPERVVYQPTAGTGSFVKGDYPDAVYFEVLMIGGGGGGGGVTGSVGGRSTVAGGASGGAGIKLLVPAADMPDVVAWEVGAGGAGGAGATGSNGIDGEATVFGDWEAGGGTGGLGLDQAATNGGTVPYMSGGRFGGTIVTGSFANPPIERSEGDTGDSGIRLNGDEALAGNGGDGPFGLGVGGLGRKTASNGEPGLGDGSGGAGALSGASAGGSTSRNGGAGASGRLVVTAYY